MTLTDSEQRFLSEYRLGRLATVGPDGVPQVKPVGFAYNAELGTIDISGLDMGNTSKYRNVQRHPSAALVVDSGFGGGPESARFLEIRGSAEAVTVESPAPRMSPEIIRIYPRRVLGLNVDPGNPGFHARDIGTEPEAA
jgi:pyridoxamine 5'-phosphate oxidase family protein